MTKAKFKGVTVRGSCKKGHLTEAVSDDGRVTWEGPCAFEGCGERVKATRFIDSAPPVEEVIISTDTKDPYTIARVKSYANRDREPRIERERDEHGKFKPAPVERVGGEPDDFPAGTAGGTEEEPPQEEGPDLREEAKRGPTFLERIRRRPRPEPVERGEIYPGIY